MPRSIKHIHYFDYFPDDKAETTYRRLLNSLEVRANLLNIDIRNIKEYFQKETEEKTQRELVERIRKEAREKARNEEEKILRHDAEERARIEIRDEVLKLIEEGKRNEAKEKERREKELIQKKADELYKREMELLKRKRAEEETRQAIEYNEINESYIPEYNIRKSNSLPIISIVFTLTLCCICSFSVLFWFYGDAFFGSF